MEHWVILQQNLLLVAMATMPQVLEILNLQPLEAPLEAFLEVEPQKGVLPQN